MGLRATREFVMLSAALALAACTSTPPARSSDTTAGSNGPTQTVTSAGSSQPVSIADAKRCPVTLPARAGPAGTAREALFGWGSSYGNGKLWVGGLWPHGVLTVGPGFIDPDGRIDMKFGWWRDVAGRLNISGRRIDAPAPPLLADVPAGYGRAGFQASGVIFPTEGCWEVTGAVHGARLTFVTFVIRRTGRSS